MTGELRPGDKIYGVYIASHEAMVRKHAEMGGFPANSVAQVRRVIDPTSAEAWRARLAWRETLGTLRARRRAARTEQGA